MNTYKYLGVNGKDCTLIESVVELTADNIKELFGFCKVIATNWSGHDKISRTLEVRNLEVCGDTIHLRHSIITKGSDNDWGHEYPWEFRFNSLIPVRDKVIVE